MWPWKIVFGQTLALWLGNGDEHRPLESNTTGQKLSRGTFTFTFLPRLRAHPGMGIWSNLVCIKSFLFLVQSILYLTWALLLFTRIDVFSPPKKGPDKCLDHPNLSPFWLTTLSFPTFFLSFLVAVIQWTTVIFNFFYLVLWFIYHSVSVEALFWMAYR